MPEFKTIKILQLPGHELTKNQEIEIINKFYEAIPEGSYLAALLKGLPQYCEQQILNDWAINPLETVDSLKRQVADTNNRNASLQKQVEGLQKQVEELEGALTAAGYATEAAQQSAKNLEESYNKTEAARHKAETARIVAESEVIRLKAKLYDYMVREQAGA